MLESEWPSEEKLQRLREEGVVPYNSLSVRLAILFSFGAFLFSIVKHWTEFLTAYQKFVGFEVLSKESFKNFEEVLLYLFILPALSTFCVVILCGLAQTKFLFNLGLFAPKITRLNPFKFPNISGFFIKFLSILLLWPLFLLAGATCLYLYRLQILVLFSRDLSDILLWPYASYKSAAPFLLTGLALAAFFIYLVARYLFMFKHRMSAAELEKDALSGG